MSVFVFGSEDDPSQYFPLQGDYAGSHILISHKGADRAKDHVTRSRGEARKLAAEIHAEVTAAPETFAAVAKRISDGPTGKVGGNLGGFNKGSMAPAFESALRKLEPGQIAPKPVKTNFGFHIIRRDPMTAKHYTCNAVIATYEGAVRLRGIRDDAPGLKRSKEEARAFLEKAAGEIDSASFDTAVKTYSDLTDTGFMGVFKQGDNALNDQLIAAIDGLDYGQVSGVVELPFGYALLKRKKVRKLSASRIYIAYAGAKRAPAGVTRSREEAAQLAEDLAAQLAGSPGRFEELAHFFPF
jgi:parvulin-like peptidyl-prolyl isomerase